MTKTKFLSIAVGLLVLLNIGTIAALMMGVGHHNRPPKPKAMVIKRLNFDADQIGQYERLIADHQEATSEKEMARREVNNSLFESLSEDQAAARDSLVQQFGLLSAELMNIHYDHFLQVKSICKEDQLPAFNQLTTELSNFFGKRERKIKRDKIQIKKHE